jgi:hypothetical protein
MNYAMARKLGTGEAVDVRHLGEEIEPGIFRLHHFIEDVDYCNAQREVWTWSIGRRKTDDAILAATDVRFYENPEFECLWLR